MKTFPLLSNLFSTRDAWIMPSGIYDLIGEEALKVDKYRRLAIDFFSTKNYSYIIPPLAEYTKSLLSSETKNLDLQTYKFSDTNTGRTLGLRSDITPQIARVVAQNQHKKNNLQNGNNLTKTFYADSALKKVAHSYEPKNLFVIGAELFKEEKLAADFEIITLMIDFFKELAVDSYVLSLNDLQIFMGLKQELQLKAEEELLFDKLVENKFIRNYAEFIDTLKIKDANLKKVMFNFLNLGSNNLNEIEKVLASISKVSSNLKKIVDMNLELLALVSKKCPDLSIYFDPADIRNKEYHTSIMFSCLGKFKNDLGYKFLARGGRYDDITKKFGVDLAATGFSLDLLPLLKYLD